VVERPARPSQPRAVLLTDQWGWGDAERQLILRQVAGAIATRAELTVVSTDGTAPERRGDGGFDLVRLASRRRADALRRALALEALCTPGASRILASVNGAMPAGGFDNAGALRRDLVDADRAAWAPAIPVLEELRPDVVVVAGTGDSGLARVLERVGPQAPVVLVPTLRRAAELALPGVGDVLARATAFLAIMPSERAVLVAHLPAGTEDRVAVMGVPVPAPDVATDEPIAALSGRAYAAVLRSSRSGVPDWAVELEVRLLDDLLGSRSLAHVVDGRVELWSAGRHHVDQPLTGDLDLGRLVAWARVTVDLRPGRLVARQSVMSLRYGTPVVVPAASIGREHAESAGAGLWFEHLGELAPAVEMVYDDEARGRALGAAGRSYADARFSSPQRFVEQVLCVVPV
jgi:hypothetical protein